MATSVNRQSRKRANKAGRDHRSHDRRAMLQWLAIGLTIVLALAAVLLFTEADGRGGHSGAPVAATSTL